MASPMFAVGPIQPRSSNSKTKQHLLAFGAIVGFSFFAANSFEMFDAILVTLGAIGYYIFEMMRRSSRTHSQLSTKRKGFSPLDRKDKEHPQLRQIPSKVFRPVVSTKRSLDMSSASARKIDMKQQSAMPVFAPRFQAADFDSEVMELLSQLKPSPETESLVGRVADAVQKKLMTVFGDIDCVESFVTADPTASKAYGVAIPEVQIVLKASISVLRQAVYHSDLQQRNEHKLNKAALRACTEALVQEGFRFRRSGFASEEPKVTLLAPSTLVNSSDAVSLDFFVNVATPSLWNALLADCEELEPKAKSLILLVRRWARDRGICHAAKGHLSPYVWGLLVIYFLQKELPACEQPSSNLVGESKATTASKTKLLPKFDQFPRSWTLASSGARAALKDTAEASSPDTMTPASLFRQFFHFYSRFDWSQDISIREDRSGRSHFSATQQLFVGDPFVVGQNLSKSFTEIGRLKEELARANDLLWQNASMTLLLEPWAPPEADVGQAEVEVAAPRF